MKENPLTMCLRRRFCRKVMIVSIVTTITFYGVMFILGDFNAPRVLSLTDLHRCPACYGISVCPELYSDQISLDWGTLDGFFNAKNIFYGFTKSHRRVVLKKLAHYWELREFDATICMTFKLKRNCKPISLLNVSNFDEKLIQKVQYNLTWPDVEPRKGLVMCPYPYSLFDLVMPVLKSAKAQSVKMNIWTMLNLNPEPIILQVLTKTGGWPVPAYGGVCGRLEVVAHEGEPLSSLMHVPWHRKLKFAKKILEAAMDFTFKHDRFRFYLMDWSLDNIVANEKDDVTFVDLEDIVVLDKHISPKRDLPNWYQRYNRESMGPGFAFSIENMCKHHLSDHNLWAACYILAGDEEPFLYPLPKEVNAGRPHFFRLLNKCLNGDDRFKTITDLQHVIDDMLMDEKIVGR